MPGDEDVVAGDRELTFSCPSNIVAVGAHVLTSFVTRTVGSGWLGLLYGSRSVAGSVVVDGTLARTRRCSSG
jgi:hypothetical protein